MSTRLPAASATVSLTTLVLVLVLVLAPGCSLRCEAPYDCDIRERSCQREVSDALQCLRGGDPIEVPLEVVDADAYSDEQRAMIDPEEREADRLWYRGLALLGLVSPELEPAQASDLRIANVGAFYDSETKAVTVLHRGRPLDGSGSVNLLAHELVHALQDAEHGIDRLHERFGTSLDASLALSAVIEGEAELYSSQLTAYALGHELDDVRWDDGLQHARQDARRSLRAHENPWIGLRADFVYAFGASYVHAAFERDGRAGVAELYEAPPVSSRQVIAGLGAEPPGGAPWLEPELAEQAVPQLSGFSLVGRVSAGAYTLETVFARWLGSERAHEAEQLATQLRADALTVQSDEAGEVATSWRLRFSSESAAAHARDIARERGLRRPARVGRDLLLLQASGDLRDPDDPTAELRSEDLVWSPVPSEDEGADAEPDPEAPARVLRCPQGHD